MHAQKCQSKFSETMWKSGTEAPGIYAFAQVKVDVGEHFLRPFILIYLFIWYIFVHVICCISPLGDKLAS